MKPVNIWSLKWSDGMNKAGILRMSGLALCMLLPGGAEAKPVQSTKYVFYNVGGTTASSVYSAMLARGPNVNGAKAYAATSAVSSQDGKLAQTTSCVIEDYRVKIDFVIKLPKLKNEAVLPASDRSRWRQFSQFLKSHEETHRSIWLGCAQELESKVKAIKVKTCNAAEARASKLWDAMRKSCGKKHDAFDKAEQKRLLQHPFVRTVLNSKRRNTHAAKAQ